MSEWTLVCDRAWMGPLIMSIFMAGVMVGAIVLGPVADKIGRRKTLYLAFTSMILANLAGAYTTSYITYVSLRFLCGFCQSGVILASFVLMNEVIGSSKRALVGVAAQAFFAIGIVLLSWMSYYVRDWRHLTVLISASGIPFALLNIFYIPESPRWLKSVGNIKEAVNILKHIALKNGTIKKWQDNASSTLSKNMENKEMYSTVASNGRNRNTDGLLDLFFHPLLLQLTLIQVFSWCVNGATYYGLTLAAGSGDKNNTGEKSLSNATPDIYTSTVFSGLIELPAYVITVPSLNRFGRRKTLVIFMIIGGVSCLLISAIEKLKIFQPYGVSSWLGLIGKLCISASFAVVYVHSNEIFPTTLRNSAMGLVSFAARIGGIAAPFLAKLGEILPNMHFFIFGITTLVSGALNMYLPETKGAPLPENIESLILMQSSKSKRVDASISAKRKLTGKGYQVVATDDIMDDSSDDL